MNKDSPQGNALIVNNRECVRRVLSSGGYRSVAGKARPEFLRAFEGALLAADTADDVADAFNFAELEPQDAPAWEEAYWRYFYAFHFESLFPECGVSLDLPDRKSFFVLVANSKPEWGLDLNADAEKNFDVIATYIDLLTNELKQNPRLFEVWAAQQRQRRS
ncbi:MAG: hypothetical protein ACJ754_01785 [Pyrinomonadaceae bacterium]